MNEKYTPEAKMFSKTDKIVFSTLGLLFVLSIVIWKSVKSFSNDKPAATEITTTQNAKDKNNKGGKKKSEEIVSQVSVVEKWDMPASLKEISALCYIDDQSFAAVQDEKGTVFFFNTRTNKIEKEVSFAQQGDFEGVAVNDYTAYVLRADGKVFEVDVTKPGKTSAKEFATSLTAKHNVEGLCFDRNKNRLLLAIKDDEPNNPDYKGIYAIDLEKKSFIEEPVYKIDLTHKVFTSGKKLISPSAIAIHPATNDIYITDGPQSRLLIMDKEGNIKQLLELGKDFSQPEGIAFNAASEMFISNEGTKQPGNILKVEIN